MRPKTFERNSIRLCLTAAAVGVGLLCLAAPHVRAAAAGVDAKCAVFSSAKDRAGCACALEQGGWVTKVHGRWRWIYPRRHQERHCHART